MMLGRTLPPSCLPPEKVITAPLTDVESAVTGLYVPSLKRGNWLIKYLVEIKIKNILICFFLG